MTTGATAVISQAAKEIAKCAPKRLPREIVVIIRIFLR